MQRLNQYSFILESSQERIGGKESQRREYMQNHKNWSVTYKK